MQRKLLKALLPRLLRLLRQLKRPLRLLLTQLPLLLTQLLLTLLLSLNNRQQPSFFSRTATPSGMVPFFFVCL